MSTPILVTPPERSLLLRLGNVSVILQLTSTDDLARVNALLQDTDLHLVAIQVTSPAAVTAFPLHGAWPDVPIRLLAPRLGPLSDFFNMRHRLIQKRVCFFLPGDNSINLRDLRIAASLGMASGLTFSNNVDFDAVLDLATYALLGLVPHGPISPFAELAEDWSPNGRIHMGRAYLDDPSRYLHISPKGQVALSAVDLQAGRFIAEDLDDLPTISKNPLYRQHTDTWRMLFLKADDCASCLGFRVCMGHHREHGPQCRDYATELLDLLEQRHEKVMKAKGR